MRKELILYKVDIKYIRNLHKIDDKVLSVSPQTGIKEKHKKMKNSMDFSKIEVNGKLLGVLNFNLMIPIEEEQLQLIDLTIYKRDRENIKIYKELCKQELEWCQEHNELICNKANVLYKKYMSDNTFSGKERCLNFSKLEAECVKFNSKMRRGSN